MPSYIHNETYTDTNILRTRGLIGRYKTLPWFHKRDKDKSKNQMTYECRYIVDK